MAPGLASVLGVNLGKSEQSLGKEGEGASTFQLKQVCPRVM